MYTRSNLNFSTYRVRLLATSLHGKAYKVNSPTTGAFVAYSLMA